MTDIDELMDDEYARVLALDAGLDAERLMDKGGAFRALIEAARDEALAAMETLISTAFTSLDGVREAQWRVTRYQDLIRWISNIVEQGEVARSDLSEEEGERLERMIRGETEKDA